MRPPQTALRSVRRRRAVLKSTTVRDFSGGWNTVDNDLNLTHKYSILADNVSREEDGSIAVRWGTAMLMDIRNVDYLDPADLDIKPYETWSITTNADVADHDIYNEDAFADGVTRKDYVDCSRLEFRADNQSAGTDLNVVFEATFDSEVNIDIITIRAPNDNPMVQTTGPVSAPCRLLIEVNTGTWETAHDVMYTIETLPSFILLTSVIEGVSLRDINVVGIRATITTTVDDDKDDLIFALASLTCAQDVSVGGVIDAVSNDTIINIYYFAESVIIVLSSGVILRTFGDGSTDVVWSPLIAAGLVGSPAGWGPTEFASFAVFNGELIVCNGTDKPLIMYFDAGDDFTVQYLANEAGSNVNVPICRYVMTTNHYVCMAGDALDPDRVHISNYDTSGVWAGDLDSSGTAIDLGKVGVQGDQIITGLNRYRQRLVVGFQSATILGILDTPDDENVHRPNFDDVIEGYGCHSHRSMVNLGNDLLMLDDQGITSLAQSLYSGSVEPKRVSELIDPTISGNVNRLQQVDTILHTHAVFNSHDKQYMCFLPNHSATERSMRHDPFEILPQEPEYLRVRAISHNFSVGDTIAFTNFAPFNVYTIDGIEGTIHTIERVISDDMFDIKPGIDSDAAGDLIGGGNTFYIPQFDETLGYVYTHISELKIRAWSRYRGWKWTASCRSELGNVIFSDATRLFVYGNKNRPTHQDYIYTNDVTDITFAWELPWADFDSRVSNKYIKYANIDIRGTATFDMMMFANELYELNGALIPSIRTTFVSGDNGSFGAGTQTYGGGRNTGTQKLYEWPCAGQLFKTRIQGATDKPLRIISLSFLYQEGGFRP